MGAELNNLNSSTPVHPSQPTFQPVLSSSTQLIEAFTPPLDSLKKEVSSAAGRQPGQVQKMALFLAKGTQAAFKKFGAIAWSKLETFVRYVADEMTAPTPGQDTPSLEELENKNPASWGEIGQRIGIKGKSGGVQKGTEQPTTATQTKKKSTTKSSSSTVASKPATTATDKKWADVNGKIQGAITSLNGEELKIEGIFREAASPSLRVKMNASKNSEKQEMNFSELATFDKCQFICRTVQEQADQIDNTTLLQLANLLNRIDQESDSNRMRFDNLAAGSGQIVLDLLADKGMFDQLKFQDHGGVASTDSAVGLNAASADTICNTAIERRIKMLKAMPTTMLTDTQAKALEKYEKYQELTIEQGKSREEAMHLSGLAAGAVNESSFSGKVTSAGSSKVWKFTTGFEGASYSEQSQLKQTADKFAGLMFKKLKVDDNTANKEAIKNAVDNFIGNIKEKYADYDENKISEFVINSLGGGGNGLATAVNSVDLNKFCNGAAVTPAKIQDFLQQQFENTMSAG